MALYNSTALIIDDDNPAIVYSGGWVLDVPSTAEYNQTKHGATVAGLTATFKFSGTGVEVYGSLGSIDVYGRPISQYFIDGTALATYTAPILAPGLAQTNVLYFRSPPLSPNCHDLQIYNENSTAPSTFWLDYLVYTPTDIDTSLSGACSSPSTSGSASLSSTSASGMASSSSSQSTSSGSGRPTSGVSQSVSSARSIPVGAITGAVVGVFVLISLLVAGLLFCRRRRSQKSDIAPFGSWHGGPTSKPEQVYQSVPTTGSPPPPPALSLDTPATAEAYHSEISKQPIVLSYNSGTQYAAGASTSGNTIAFDTETTITRQYNNSGFHIPPITDLPPAYSAD